MTDALALAAELRSVLERQLALSREEPERLRAIDTDALLKAADDRGVLHSAAIGLLARLTAARAHVPDSAELSASLGHVRALATDLRNTDSVNRELAERSLGIVRGLLQAGQSTNRASAYDRRGARVEGTGPLLQSRRA